MGFEYGQLSIPRVLVSVSLSHIRITNYSIVQARRVQSVNICTTVVRTPELVDAGSSIILSRLYVNYTRQI